MTEQKIENSWKYKEEWDFLRDVGLLMLLFLACIFGFIGLLVWILG
jgi:hypothetical protein